MKLTDVIALELARRGTRHVFGLTGGAVVHLFDSVADHPDMTPVFHHHEQAASFALVANGRARDGVGVGMFTTGPGGLNALAGVTGAWMDSIPALFISGQARREHCSGGTGTRQVGIQEFDIVTLVKPITKYAVLLQKPEDILYELDRCFYEATRGRPGPVWLDVPMNFQWADVDPDSLRRFEGPPPDAEAPDVSEAVAMLSQARRPLLVLGGGIRAPRARAAAEAFAHRLRVPYVVTYSSLAFWPSDDPLNLGILGVTGQRGANLAVQNCDLLLAVGNHLCVSQTGTLFSRFSPRSRRIVVNVDPSQLAFETVRVDHRVRADAGAFFEAMESALGTVPDWDPKWIDLASRYRAVNDRDVFDVDPANTDLDQYSVVRAIADRLTAGDSVVIDGGGTNVYISHQALRVKRGQRVVLASGLCAMGSGIPEAIGVAAATGRRTVCLVGDGSVMLNLQELQTVVTHRLPVKIVIFNNGGYVSIRQTQADYLDGRFVGSSTAGGVDLPDFRAIATAFGLPTVTLDDRNAFAEPLTRFLDAEGPGVCEVFISPRQTVRPRQGVAPREDGTSAQMPLDSMAPFLSRDEQSALSPWTDAD